MKATYTNINQSSLQWLVVTRLMFVFVSSLYFLSLYICLGVHKHKCAKYIITYAYIITHVWTIWGILYSFYLMKWCISFFCHLDTDWVIWAEGTSVEELLPLDWARGKSVHICLINSWCGRAQAFMGYAVPGKVFLSYVKKQADQAMRIKLGGCIPSWALHHFLPLVPALSSPGDGL